MKKEGKIVKIKELIEKLNLREITCSDLEREISGCYIGDLLSWVMSKAQGDNIWITIQSNVNIVAVASLTDVTAVIVAEDVQVEDEVVQKAEMQEINLLGSSLNSYELACKIKELL